MHQPPRLIIVGLTGVVIGFTVPHLRQALAEQPTSVRAIGDDQKKPDKKPPEKKTECSCEPVACTSSDGMHNWAAQCTVHCDGDQVPECKCATCTEGRLDHQSSCQCKNAE